MLSQTTRAHQILPSVILTPDEQSAVKAIMRAHGIRRAHMLLGVARHAMERAGGGLTIQRGTAALIRAALARLSPPSSEVL
ncbi:MAG: hypothetical protein ACLP66_10325 [Polyangia bacterium]